MTLVSFEPRPRGCKNASGVQLEADTVVVGDADDALLAVVVALPASSAAICASSAFSSARSDWSSEA